jgi:hypothetical protein
VRTILKRIAIVAAWVVLAGVAGAAAGTVAAAAVKWWAQD